MYSEKSLEEIEKSIYNPLPSPVETFAETVLLSRLSERVTIHNRSILLDGEWEMVQDGNVDRVYGNWENIIPARIPGSVHTALIEQGKIPDPTFEKLDEVAREKSRHFWWFRKRFLRPEGYQKVRLVFDGICDRCTIWLNGRLLGSHQGMFGGPEFDITALLQDENVLIVMLYPAPYRVGRAETELNPFFDQMNIGWLDTTVFNCVYGWHYANIPTLGIWRSVKLQEIPEIEMETPFIATKSIEGNVQVALSLLGPEGGFSGVIRGEVSPINFTGESYHFVKEIISNKSRKKESIAFTIPNVQLWWPNGTGNQNLYSLRLSLQQEETIVDQKEIEFGVRTVEMRPILGTVKDDLYNWQFVINDRPLFVKGANWCTIDFAMRFTNEKYDRFLRMAKEQHLQLLRAWGGGMPETNEFYALCNRYGIMVLQEFATAWDSQKIQPADVLREGVERTVLRLRNNPSLVMWGGGNESVSPTDAVIDMMGRIVYELDGTRVFHRNDPWGGSSHNYEVYWGGADFDYNLSYQAPFIGEFGFASSPNQESVRMYLSDSAFSEWPPQKGGAVEYHTPVFNQKRDMDIINRYVPEFLPNNSLDNLIVATQMCQSTALRHTLELARTRYPEASGICYYKLTDVFPSISWSTMDWYGVPKSSYYFVQDSLEPLHACVLFSTLQPMGMEQRLPVFLLDDNGVLSNDSSWRIQCRAFGSTLQLLHEETWAGVGCTGQVRKMGEFILSAECTKEIPLLIVIELQKDGIITGRTFYWLNFKAKCGCLFQLPKTDLRLIKLPGKAVIENVGSVPAVGVHFVCETISYCFSPQDNFIWLNAGEQVEISVDRDDYDGILAWNAGLSEEKT